MTRFQSNYISSYFIIFVVVVILLTFWSKYVFNDDISYIIMLSLCCKIAFLRWFLPVAVDGGEESKLALLDVEELLHLVIDPADDVGHVRVHRRHPLLSATDAPGHDSRLKHSTSSGVLGGGQTCTHLLVPCILQVKGLPPSPLHVSTPLMPPAQMKDSSSSKKPPSRVFLNFSWHSAESTTG